MNGLFLVSSECESNFEVNAFYINKTPSCENLMYIQIRDTACKPFPPPGNCWESYEEATLQLPKELDTSKTRTVKLRKDEDSLEWISMECHTQGIYNVSILLLAEEFSCDKTLILNLTSFEESKEFIPFSGYSLLGPLLIMIAFISLTIASLFLIFKRK